MSDISSRMDISPASFELSRAASSGATPKKTKVHNELLTVCRELGLLREEVGRLQEAIYKEKSRRSSADVLLREQGEVIQKLMEDVLELGQLRADLVTARLDISNLQADMAALRVQLSSSMEAVKASDAKCGLLEQALSEQAAKAVATGRDSSGAVSPATQEAILEAIRKERLLSASQSSKQHMQLSTIMVLVEESTSTADVASSLVKEAGVQPAAVLNVTRVTSGKATSSYTAAVQSNGSGGGSSGSDDESGSGSSGGSRGGAKPAHAVGSHRSSGSKGGVWFRVGLANPALALQVLRKRGALRKAGLRVEEALSKEEHVIKMQYLEAKIPALVWDNEGVPVSWRRGRLVKLVKGEMRHRWEEVPLSYSVTEKK